MTRAGVTRGRIGVALALGALGCSGSPDVVARWQGGTFDPENPPGIVDVSGDIEVRDPAAIEAGGVYYLFHTGNGLSFKTSADLKVWRAGANVFSENPSWIEERVPGVGELWSPAIRFFGGTHHLYYAASVFGDDRSCIGHATKADLAASEAWSDRGAVICSNVPPAQDDWNAIDPGVLLASDGTPWLVLGSYQGGIQLLKLDTTGARADSELHPLAARPDDGNAVQQAELFERGGNYYLFTSFDLCCRGVDSTHKIMVGRAATPEGPYFDRDGRALLDGGGTLVLAGDDRYRGPGSNVVLHTGAKDYDVYHAYDANNSGRATLRIAELVWDDEGWPVSGGP